MTWQCALIVSIVFTLASTIIGLIYCDIKSKEDNPEK